MSELTELLARIEAATGPDREIDLDLALIHKPHLPREYWLDDELERLEFGSHRRYTNSVDACIALIAEALPGWSWQIRVCTSGDGEVRYTNARVWSHFNPRDDESPTYWANASDETPVLALLAAILKALIAQETDQ